MHELGHAIVHYIHNGETNLKVITVVPEGTGTLGYVLHTTPKEKVLLTKRDYYNQIEELLAGRAAEELLLGKENISSGCWNDLEKASETVTRLCDEFGMSDTMGLLSAKGTKPGVELTDETDREKKNILEECYRRVLETLDGNRAMFDAVLEELMEKGTMDGGAFVTALKKNMPAEENKHPIEEEQP